MSQQKKTVLVTGGRRGIGAAIVFTLRESGYHVLYTSRESCADEDCYQLELADGGSIQNLYAELMNSEVQLYGLVNNAAVCNTSELMESSSDFVRIWHDVISVNLTGQALLTYALMPLMEPTPTARIVNISSQLGKIGRAGYSAYCASKFGLIGLTEAWSRELASSGMTVNAVCPGWVQTDMTDQDLDRMAEEQRINPRQLRADLYESLDLERFNTPEEVANIVRFLLSEDASGITGRCIEMAGPSR